MAHAILSPSHIYTWGACPGAPALEKDAPPQPPSPEAELGTQAHRLAELRLRSAGFGAPLNEAEQAEYAEKLTGGDAEMLKATHLYVRTLLNLFGGADKAELSAVEDRLSLERVTGEDAYGTADFTGIQEETLFIADFKYGENVKVPKRNPQLMVYALAALQKYDPEGLVYGIERVSMTVVQPRILDEEGRPHIATETIAREGLEAFGRELRKAADRCFELYADPSRLNLPENADALRPSDDACRWCRGKALCPAFADRFREVVAAEFDQLPGEPAPLEIPLPATPESMAKAMAAIPVLRKWADETEKLVMHRMLSGGEVPGLKLVESRAGIRRWGDEEAAERILRKALGAGGAFEKKLLSPAKAERAKLGPKTWDQLKALIVRDDPKPAIAPESDNRPDFNRPDPRIEFSKTAD